ncbi:MAG: IS256 family transposase [Nitrospinaceae bacterium]|jgi:putative transposase|nr:IS256 family transposase [Nitrospinaceae bacterium]|tara:strand:+ start:85 stop:1323 length:1239 start_codon:yes stop_codon:yes gene_type:complete
MAEPEEVRDQLLNELVDELVEDCKSAEDLLGENGIVKQLTKRVLERMLQAEMTDHLGYEKDDPAGRGSGNSRNGRTRKTVQTDQSEVTLAVPRDRNAEFEPQIVPKHQRRLKGFDDKVISLYARGMTDREITGHLQEMYGVSVSPELISNVTDVVIDEVKCWQTRPLDEVYPIVYLDAIFVKIRDEGTVQKKAIYLALGINLEGEKELLGLWISKTEGAKFWLGLLTELQNRGLKDIFIVCVDGLGGFPEAIETVFPKTQVQLCIVHLVRNSLRFVSWKDRKTVAADLKPIYKAATAEEAESHLEAFEEKWDETYPSISKSWRKHWANIIPFFAYPEEIRKVIYTTNAIESMNRSLRKIIKNRGAFPSDEAATKLMFLALRNISKRWTKPLMNWKAALNRFAIMFEDRAPLL